MKEYSWPGKQGLHYRRHIYQAKSGLIDNYRQSLCVHVPWCQQNEGLEVHRNGGRDLNWRLWFFDCHLGTPVLLRLNLDSTASNMGGWLTFMCALKSKLLEDKDCSWGFRGSLLWVSQQVFSKCLGPFVDCLVFLMNHKSAESTFDEGLDYSLRFLPSLWAFPLKPHHEL